MRWVWAVALVWAVAAGTAQPQELGQTVPNAPPTGVVPPALATAPVDHGESALQGPAFSPPASIPPPRPDLGLPDFGGRGLGGGPGYAATWLPAAAVEGQDADLALIRQSLMVGLPLRKADGDLSLLTASVRHSLFFTDALLPDTGQPFPEELWNVSLGLLHSHRFENGWTGGLMTSVGSASDIPFHGLREMAFGLSGFLKVPVRDGRDAWLFSVMYNSAGNLNFPLPGVAYVWNPSEALRMSLGLPFSVRWCPSTELTFDLAYVPLTNINARATWRLAEALRLYAGYEFLNEAWFLVDRPDRQDRFMAFEQRVLSGLRWDLAERIALDLSTGYAFGRRYGEGQNQGGDLFNRVDVAPGAFLSAALRLRY